jgi:hypothetical protein
LLNEPSEAESICRDVLQVDPGNTEARVTLLLSLTDQFGGVGGTDPTAARAVLKELADPYQHAYYGGIICERWAKALFHRHALGSGAVVHHWLSEAMKLYEVAEKLRRPGDDDAILRWNACVRLLAQHPDLLTPRADDPSGPITLE